MSKQTRTVAAWAFVVSLIVVGIMIARNGSDVEEVAPPVEEVAVDTTPIEVTELLAEESVEVEIAPPITDNVLNFREDGVLIVPFPDYDNFGDAFNFARAMLGDSIEHGVLRIFLWRGSEYHTETIEQQ
jgi:hypothetical protein|tara:strand:+ start:998 stop:1384 length:387 start_codon:yes stop_codon:yes gene_type:complete